MSKTWYPVIDDEMCIECGKCLKKCQHGVYKKDSDHPVVIYPDGCIEGCHGCGNLCPVGAIDYAGAERSSCCDSAGLCCDPSSCNCS